MKYDTDTEYSSSSEEETEVSFAPSLLSSPEKPTSTSRITTTMTTTRSSSPISPLFTASATSSSSTSPIIMATIPDTPTTSTSPIISLDRNDNNSGNNGNDDNDDKNDSSRGAEWKPKPTLFRAKMCSFYYHKKECQKGDLCNFSHVFLPGMEVPPLPMDINYRNPPQAQPHYECGTHNVPCKYYARGNCILGSNCKFSHAMPPVMYSPSLDFRPYFPGDRKKWGFGAEKKKMTSNVKAKTKKAEEEEEGVEQKANVEGAAASVRKLVIVRKKN